MPDPHLLENGPQLTAIFADKKMIKNAKRSSLEKVYELMGVDTEKEMDVVTRKVDRVFQVT